MPSKDLSSMRHVETSTFQEMLYQHARAMSYVSVVYSEENFEVKELLTSLLDVVRQGRKLVFVGSGKSLKIIQKSVAMLTSLGIEARELHPSEALHGDMGLVKAGDALIVCSSSGETQELVVFLEYAKRVLEPSVKVLVTSSVGSTLHSLVDRVLYVPQPTRFQEKVLQEGLPSPTVSTTLMLVVLDCFCLALSELYFEGDMARRRGFFQRMHPGGGIGKQLETPVVAKLESAIDADAGHELCGQIPPEASESEFLECVVQFDYCIVDGVQYSSHLLQHRYRRWKRNAFQPSAKYATEKAAWDLATVLGPPTVVHM